MKKTGFVLTLVFLGFFSFQVNANELKAFSDFNKEEVTKFLNDWVDFVEWAQDEEEYFFDPNYSDLKIQSGTYSKDVVKWVEKKGWVVDRFFDLERRVNLALRAYYIKQEKEKENMALIANIRALEKNTILPQAQLQLMIKEIKNKIDSNKVLHLRQGVSEDEINIIGSMALQAQKIISYGR